MCNDLSYRYLQGLRAVEFKQQISSRSDPFGLDTILSGAQLQYFEK